jgi:hypothetical protein
MFLLSFVTQHIIVGVQSHGKGTPNKEPWMRSLAKNVPHPWALPIVNNKV